MRKLTALLALMVVLAACSQGETAVDVVEGPGEGAPEPTYAASTDEMSGRGLSQGDAVGSVDVQFDIVDDRKVIRRASLALHATDTRETFDEIVRLTESAGGFVADAEVFESQGDEDAQPRVTMTVRVPADELTSTMAAIKDRGDEVVSESQGAEDVTEQFVDLEARLRNLEALEVELRALLEEVRKQPEADPQKLLMVFNELSSVRGQIEQIQGQINYLKDKTTLATLQIDITQTPSTTPIVDQPWEPMVAARDALSSLVTSLQGVTDWAINFALYTLPILLLTLGIPGLVIYLLYRRFIRRRGHGTSLPTPAES